MHTIVMSDMFDYDNFLSPITGSSSLKNPIVARYGSSELNLSQSLPVIVSCSNKNKYFDFNSCMQRVSDVVPDEKRSLMKTKDRFPNYDCVVGSILHALNCECIRHSS